MRDLQERRPATTGERFARAPQHQRGDRFPGADRRRPARDGIHQLPLVRALVQREAAAFPFEQPALRLRRDLQNRRARRVRLPHGRGGIRRARPRRRYRNAEPPGRARVAVRGIHGGLLVAHDDRADGGPLERVEDREVVHTRDAEHDLDAEGFELVGEDARARRRFGAFPHGLLSRRLRAWLARAPGAGAGADPLRGLARACHGRRIQDHHRRKARPFCYRTNRGYPSTLDESDHVSTTHTGPMKPGISRCTER